MEGERSISKKIVDSDLVSFFDLLARFDYEDQQKARLALLSDSSVCSPSEESLKVAK